MSIFRHLYFIGVPLLVILFVACGNSKKSREKNNPIVKGFIMKYKAVDNWDTIPAYTSYYQNEFITDGSPMIFKGSVYDVVKTDSNYLIKVLDNRKDAIHNFLAIINFTNKQFYSYYTDDKSNAGVFVMKVSKITTSNPSIKVDETEDSEGNTYTYTYLSDDAEHKLTVFTGTLIDCQFEVYDTKD